MYSLNPSSELALSISNYIYKDYPTFPVYLAIGGTFLIENIYIYGFRYHFNCPILSRVPILCIIGVELSAAFTTTELYSMPTRLEEIARKMNHEFLRTDYGLV